MSIISNAKSGADLTRPKASGSWITGAVVGIVMLLVAFAVASYLYVKGKKAVSGVTTQASGAIGSGSTVTGAGFAYGDGV